MECSYSILNKYIHFTNLLRDHVPFVTQYNSDERVYDETINEDLWNKHIKLEKFLHKKIMITSIELKVKYSYHENGLPIFNCKSVQWKLLLSLQSRFPCKNYEKVWDLYGPDLVLNDNSGFGWDCRATEIIRTGQRKWEKIKYFSFFFFRRCYCWRFLLKCINNGNIQEPLRYTLVNL